MSDLANRCVWCVWGQVLLARYCFCSAFKVVGQEDSPDDRGMAFSISKILEGLGFSPGDVSQFQFGPGVVGNTTTAVVVAVIGTAAEAYFLSGQPPVMFGAMGLTLVIVLVYLFGTWTFAGRHPDLALMGGADLLQLRRMEMAARNPEIMLDVTPTQAPTTPPPAIEPPGGAGG